MYLFGEPKIEKKKKIKALKFIEEFLSLSFNAIIQKTYFENILISITTFS